jgi:hypothetical protein
MVSDKINYRPRGPNAALTRQPLQGRDKEGGLRIGEMERDGLIANGMAGFVKESMMTRGDGTMVVHNTRKPYKICVDNSSGLMAIYNEHTNLKISPTIDGIQFDGNQLTTIPTYNKSFSTLNVPYCFKLLMQELIIMNVYMRIITSDSLDHMESMNNSSIESLFPSIFQRLSSSMDSFMRNKLYVSKINVGVPPSFKHKQMAPTLFPFLENTEQYNLLKYISRTITPHRYEPMFNKDKFKLDIYRTDGTSVERTMDYFWNKMKTGIFVRIKNNKLFNFNPFYNVLYKNDFSDQIPKEQLDALFTELKKDKSRFKDVSTDPSTWHATNCLLRIEKELAGMHLRIDEQEVWTSLIGTFNAYNLLAVFAVAVLLGQDKVNTLTALSTLKSVEGRFQYIQSDNKITAIVDYAHTPDALHNVLRTINELRTGNEQVIALVGCGGDRDAAKRPEMARIACDLSDRVILTSDNPRSEDPDEIIRQMKAGVDAVNYKKVLSITDRREAIHTACALSKPGDIILVAGKGHEKYQEIKGVKYPFDDMEELNQTFNIQGI